MPSIAYVYVSWMLPVSRTIHDYYISCAVASVSLAAPVIQSAALGVDAKHPRVHELAELVEESCRLMSSTSCAFGP